MLRRWVIAGVVVSAFPAPVLANDPATSVSPNFDGLGTLWVLIAAFLVFFMQAGFGMVEAGLIRAKNAANILMKNLLDFCFASLGFFLCGYALMFGGDGKLFGTQGFFLINAESVADGIPLEAFRGVAHDVELFQKVRLEIAVTDEAVDRTVNAIVRGGNESGGHGKIFVVELRDCVSVKTGERGPEAI